MSFELYFAGSSVPEADEWIISNKHNRLYSYLNDKSSFRRYINRGFEGKMFVDSGAFSAWTKGHSISVKQYIDWLNENSKYLHLFGQLDSIPGDRIFGASVEEVCRAGSATWDNYLFMRKRLKTPESLLYTFHVGEPFRFLQNALDWIDDNGKKIPYIALGGMVGKPRRVRDVFLDKVFSIIKNSNNPDVRVHAFGMTDFSLLSQYPISSADSTSWIMVGAMGNIMTDFGVIPVSNNYKGDPQHFSHIPASQLSPILEYIGEFGFTLEELSETPNSRILFNAMYMQKKSDSLTNIRKKTMFRKKLF